MYKYYTGLRKKKMVMWESPISQLSKRKYFKTKFYTNVVYNTPYQSVILPVLLVLHLMMFNANVKTRTNALCINYTIFIFSFIINPSWNLSVIGSKLEKLQKN